MHVQREISRWTSPFWNFSVLGLTSYFKVSSFCLLGLFLVLILWYYWRLWRGDEGKAEYIWTGRFCIYSNRNSRVIQVHAFQGLSFFRVFLYLSSSRRFQEQGLLRLDCKLARRLSLLTWVSGPISASLFTLRPDTAFTLHFLAWDDGQQAGATRSLCYFVLLRPHHHGYCWRKWVWLIMSAL